MTKIIKNFKNGLTLVETLVAITILLIGVLGPLNIAARGIGDGIFAANQLAANYLAQEALEVIINHRYEITRVYLPPPPPGTTVFSNDGQFGPCLTTSLGSNYCVMDNVTDPLLPTFNTSSVCNDTDTSCQLVYNTASGFYQKPSLDSGPASHNQGTVFTRKVKITAVTSDEIKVVVTLSWNNKAIPKSFSIVEHLFTNG